MFGTKRIAVLEAKVDEQAKIIAELTKWQAEMEAASKEDIDAPVLTFKAERSKTAEEVDVDLIPDSAPKGVKTRAKQKYNHAPDIDISGLPPAIKFDKNEFYTSSKFKHGTRSAAYERLIRAVQKRGGMSLVEFAGHDFDASASGRGVPAPVYVIGNKLGVTVRGHRPHNMGLPANTALIIVE